MSQSRNAIRVWQLAEYAVPHSPAAASANTETCTFSIGKRCKRTRAAGLSTKITRTSRSVSAARAKVKEVVRDALVAVAPAGDPRRGGRAHRPRAAISPATGSWTADAGGTRGTASLRRWSRRQEANPSECQLSRYLGSAPELSDDAFVTVLPFPHRRPSPQPREGRRDE